MEACSQSEERLFKLFINLGILSSRSWKLHYYLKKYFISFNYLCIFSKESSDYSETVFIYTIDNLKEIPQCTGKKNACHVKIIYWKDQPILCFHTKKPAISKGNSSQVISSPTNFKIEDILHFLVPLILSCWCRHISWLEILRDILVLSFFHVCFKPHKRPTYKFISVLKRISSFSQ